jgi:uncharacterized small protein (DUF1192 family)
MSVRCEEAKQMRSACEQVLKIGAEKDERINLLQAEIVRMQEERMTDDAKDLAGNLRKEISDLQANYQRASENASELQSRLALLEGKGSGLDGLLRLPRRNLGGGWIGTQMRDGGRKCLLSKTRSQPRSSSGQRGGGSQFTKTRTSDDRSYSTSNLSGD